MCASVLSFSTSSMIEVSSRLQEDDGLRSTSLAYARGGRGLESDDITADAFAFCGRA
jgi:hypothetical protein